MKKLLSLMLVSFLLLLGVNSAALGAVQEIKKDSKHFEQLGFTKEEIATFSDWEKEKYSKVNGAVVSKNSKYYRVTPNEAAVELTEEEALLEVEEFKAMEAKKKKSKNQQISIMSNGSDTESSSWIRLDTTVTDLGNKRFFFKNSFTWLTNPIVALTDVVGITHPEVISNVQDSAYLKYTYDRYSYGVFAGTQNIYYWTANTATPAGYAFKYDLLNSDGSFDVLNNRGYMVYEGQATPISFVGSSNAYGHYAHQQFTTSISVNLSSGAMSVSPSFAFDNTYDTNAQFYVQ